MMYADIVTHEMNRLDVRGDFPIQMLQQGHEFLLGRVGQLCGQFQTDRNEV
jgi:hypothetical protein